MGREILCFFKWSLTMRIQKVFMGRNMLKIERLFGIMFLWKVPMTGW